MKHLLIVLEEEQSLLAMQAGGEPYKDRFEILTARSAKEAKVLLASVKIHLVVTDLKMPAMEGLELLAFLKNKFPEVPAIVIAGFGNTEIESQHICSGMICVLEKPVGFKKLIQLIITFFEKDITDSTPSGAYLASFFQLIEMRQYTCLMEVQASSGNRGILYFKKGVLYDAVFGKTTAEEAAYNIMLLDNIKIKFHFQPDKKIKQRIMISLKKLILEGMRRRDMVLMKATAYDSAQNPIMPESSVKDQTKTEGSDNSKSIEGEDNMATIKEILEKFKVVDGFQAAGAFSPNGELVDEYNVAGVKLGELGALANDVLLKAQKATEMMNVGRGQLVHVEAPKAHIICRCLNEATDFASTASGRAHVHMVVIIDKEGNVAMSKMKVDSLIQEVAEFFR